MRRLLSVCLLMLVFSLGFVCAEVHLAIEPRLGMMVGTVGEYVLLHERGGGHRKYSQLDWEERFLPTVGVAASGTFGRLSVEASVDRTVSPSFPWFRSVASGTMRDSDWLVAGTKTHYSKSENDVSLNVQAGLVVSYEFAPTDFLRFVPFAEISYSYKSFEARNGYGWYGDKVPGGPVAWDDPRATFYPVGSLCGVDYTCHQLSLFTGLNVRFRCSERVSVQVGIAVLPYGYVYAEDIHYSNLKGTDGTYYVDIVHSFLSRCKGSLAVAFRVNRLVELGATVTGLVGGMDSGDTYIKAGTGGSYTKSASTRGGFSIREATVRLSAKVFVF